MCGTLDVIKNTKNGYKGVKEKLDRIQAERNTSCDAIQDQLDSMTDHYNELDLLEQTETYLYYHKSKFQSEVKDLQKQISSLEQRRADQNIIKITAEQDFRHRKISVADLEKCKKNLIYDSRVLEEQIDYLKQQAKHAKEGLAEIKKKIGKQD
jgi:predicted nuclease with TOPRIM domain